MDLLWIILGILLVGALIFFIVLYYHVLLLKHKSRKLAKKKEYFDVDKQIAYASKLVEMINCKTVSIKGQYDDSEFELLRQKICTLFPNISLLATKMTFSDDCWVYKINGLDQTRNIMLMSHHDVVPADNVDEWKHPPFAGAMSEGKVWGRGSVDTKTSLFAELQAMEEIMEEGFRPACNIYIASSHNEEISGDGIPKALEFFKKEGITFELIIDEGGAIIDAPITGMKCKCAMLAVHEKGRHTLALKAEDKTTHDSLSINQNPPIVRMANFISTINKKDLFIQRMHPQVKAMFEELCPYMPFYMQLIFANLWCSSGIIIKMMPKLNPLAGAMIGTTCAFSSIRGRIKTSTNPNECSATVQMRSIDINDLESDVYNFIKLANAFGIIVNRSNDDEFHQAANMNEPGYSYVKKCVGEVFPDVACAPFILPAGTDARHFSEICQSVIRFAPIVLDAKQFASVHGTDENIDISAIGAAVVFYKYLIKNYS